MNKTLVRLSQAAGLLAAGMLFGYLAPAQMEVMSLPQNVASCEGGTQSDLQIALTPMAVKSGKSGERLLLSVDVHTRFAGKARAKIAVELRDHRGRSVMAPKTSEALSLKSGREGMQSIEVLTPQGLRDGYYVLMATGAALSTEGAGAENIAQMYLQREGGEFRTLTYEEYVTSSDALVEVAQK